MSETPNPPTPPENPSTPPAGIPPATPPAAISPPTDNAEMGDPADVEKNKVFAILGYLGILCVVPLFAAKDSRFAKFHGNQGLILFLGWMVIVFVMVFASIILHFIPFLGAIVGCFSMCIWPLLAIAYLVYAILGILNAVNGKMKPLPFIPVITLVK